MVRRIFLSSVQRELASERRAIRDLVEGDALLRRFFSVFLFEDLPATDRRTDQVYLDEVDRCDLYLGVFGIEYGPEDVDGISPTEREYDRATRSNKTRLVFVKGSDDDGRHPRMRALVSKACAQLVRRRFASTPELLGSLYAALVRNLEELELIRTGPFDATPCPLATLEDLDVERMSLFLDRARRTRNFPIPAGAAPDELLAHLNLLDRGRLTNAAVLLFGKRPQRFLIPSEVKCAHFHGTVVEKPIPSYQIYKGTLFELVDQAVDFVMSKINLAVGTRSGSNQAPVAYEIPPEVVREAIVNAVAHRDYTSKGSVQVMLFSDRLEVWNPGTLPPSLTLDMLRHPHGSVPGNPLLAEALYLAKYIEKMGTGTRDMIARCRVSGIPEPQFAMSDGFVVTLGRQPQRALELVTPEVAGKMTPQVPRKYPASTPQVIAVLESAANGEQSREALQAAAGLKDREHFRSNYLEPMISSGLLERTRQDRPRSSRQTYRITDTGRALLAESRRGRDS